MENKNLQLWKEIWDWVKTIGIAVALALFIRAFVLNLSIVPTGSMIPTIQINDRIVVLKFSYWFTNPKPGDIIVFHSPTEENKQLVKRLIAVGNDSVEIKDGVLYINGKPKEESYLREKMKENFGPYTIPEGCYFVMGDNRNNSFDARKWDQKYITRDMVIGKAVCKLFGPLK